MLIYLAVLTLSLYFLYTRLLSPLWTMHYYRKQGVYIFPGWLPLYGHLKAIEKGLDLTKIPDHKKDGNKCTFGLFFRGLESRMIIL